MKISIVTPSFNQAEFIERTILSIWSQEGDFELEHIIADGGSTDDSVKIIKKYDELYKNKKFDFKCKKVTFKWWSKKDKGQSDALNKGFQASTGDILGWLNSDDTFCSNHSLQKVFQAFQKYPEADVIAGNLYYIDVNDKNKNKSEYISELPEGPISEREMKNLYQIDYIPQPSTLFKKEVYEECKIDENWYYAMDWDLWVTAYRKGFKIYKTDDFIGNLRVQENAKTTIGGIKMYREKLKFYKKYKTWGLNRVNCYFFFIQHSLNKIPVLGTLFEVFVKLLGKVRRFLFKKSLPVS